MYFFIIFYIYTYEEFETANLEFEISYFTTFLYSDTVFNRMFGSVNFV